MPAGTFGHWPAGIKHFVWVKGETVVQLHGMGPWSIEFANPDNDPPAVFPLILTDAVQEMGRSRRSPKWYEQQARASERMKLNPACCPQLRHCSGWGRMSRDGPRGVSMSDLQWMTPAFPPGASTRKTSRRRPTGSSTWRMLKSMA